MNKVAVEALPLPPLALVDQCAPLGELKVPVGWAPPQLQDQEGVVVAGNAALIAHPADRPGDAELSVDTQNWHDLK